MDHLQTLQTEYEQARDKWIEVNQLRTDWESEDPVYSEVLRDYREKKGYLLSLFAKNRAQCETGT